MREECIEITNELLKRFNAVLVSFPAMIDKDTLMKNLLGQLMLPNAGLRKRACSCLGSLAVILAPKQLTYLIGQFLQNINPEDKVKSWPFIEPLGAVATTVGYKLAPNLNAIMKAFERFCVVAPHEDKILATDHMIKEICLTVYDFSIRKCPKEVSAHLDHIVSTVLGLMSYDPNYNADAAAAPAAGQDEGLDAWGDDVVEAPQSGDDTSWKVRKAATKVLATIVKYRADKIKPLYTDVLSNLLSRLIEKEESIKCEILSILTDLIKGMVVGDSSASDVDDFEAPLLLTRKSSAEVLLKGIPNAVILVTAHCNDKSVQVRESIALLLYNMAVAVPDYMNGTLLPVVLPKLLANYKESSSTVKVIVLQTLRRLIRTSLSADAYGEFVGQIVAVLTMATKEDYYKLIAEGIKTSSALVRLLAKESGPLPPEAQAAIKSIYDICNVKFQLADIDQDIKQSVILAMATLVATGHNMMNEKQIDDVLVTMQERLKNDGLRHAVMKGFHIIVVAHTKLPIEKRLETLLPDFLQMTHKTSRPVSLAALETLVGVCEKYPSASTNSANLILQHIADALKEIDLRMVQLGLKIARLAVPHATPDALRNLLEAVYTMCKNTLINTVLEETKTLVCALMQKGQDPAALCETLSTNCVDKTLRATAAIVAGVVMLNDKDLPQLIELYTKVLGEAKENELKRKLAALILGSIGQHKDLSKNAGLNSLLQSLLKNSDEEMKVNAAICLGNVALGNKAHYLPEIMGQLKAQNESSYLMLVALREIVILNPAGLVERIGELLPILRAQADTKDDGGRTIVAEILGKLLEAQERAMADEVEKALGDSKENVRAAFALSFKYWYHKGKKDVTQFGLSVLKLMPLFKDPSIIVQKALLDSLTQVAHINAFQLRTQSPIIFAGSIPMTVLRPELVHTVDLGPLQHKIDAGEPVRKGAYLLLENMLAELYDKMDLPILADRLVDGLADESDEVQNSCQQILIKLCDLSPGAILGPLEKLVDQIVKAIKRMQEKIKKQQDVDRATDSIRCFLRVLLAMNRLPEIDLNQKYQDSLKELLKEKTVAGLYEEMAKITK